MTNDLTKKASTGIAIKDKLWLLNLENGRVLPWTAYLAVKINMIDCTEDGEPINPKDVPADHPWIKKATKGLRDRLAAAGADPDTLAQVGRQLTEDGEKKFKALADQSETKLRIGTEHPWSEPLSDKIERMVWDAKCELSDMTLSYLHKLNGTEYRDATRARSREVSYSYLKQEQLERLRC